MARMSSENDSSWWKVPNIVPVLWSILLIPWLPFALLAGMAFDGGYKWEAYTFVSSLWTYPVTVAAVWAFRRRWPFVVCLPLLNVAGVFASSF